MVQRETGIFIHLSENLRSHFWTKSYLIVFGNLINMASDRQRDIRTLQLTLTDPMALGLGVLPCPRAWETVCELQERAKSCSSWSLSSCGTDTLPPQPPYSPASAPPPASARLHGLLTGISALLLPLLRVRPPLEAK